jgi:hypothetical protein
MAESASTTAVDEPNDTSDTQAVSRNQRNTLAGIIIAVVILLGLLITSIVFLLLPSTDASTVSRIRDVFIILMALESLLIGLVLIVLMIQLARLTNLLQNEIKPILDSTNETVSTLRGTTAFLSTNLVEPVIKLNQSLAALHKFIELLGIGRKRQ